MNTVFAAAPFYETDNDGVLNLIFKQNLFFNTTGKTVSSLQVNFDDGNGFITAAWKSTVSANYMDTGIKKLTFKMNFDDATSLQGYSNVRILKAAVAARYMPSTVTLPFEPTNNNHSGGDITVQYSVNNITPTSNRKFQKPFIVVEGFDMHDAAPLLMPNGYDYESFRLEISNVFFPNVISFNGNLDDIAGYDLIFLNYRDGTDDILRNALLLEEVINWVNANKAVGAQQNVVMGISMGGLVSRYCLAKMTKANNNPQTRLLITHDSPHRGANIPLGLQYMLNDFSNQKILGKKLQTWIPLLQQAVNLQLRPAPMQQLIVRNNPSNGNLEYNSFLANNGVYRNMVTFLPAHIQPTYTFVATSQGSQCGIPVLPPSAEIIKTSGEAGYTIGFGSFGNKLSGSLIINALPNGTASHRIAYFKLKFTTTIFWINLNTTLLNYSHNSPAGILGYDGAPAGTQPMSRGTGIGNVPPTWGSGPSFLPPFIFEYVYKFSGLQVAPEFSFVSTSSALDEDNITASSLYGPHLGTFYSPPANVTHLQKYVAQEKITFSGVQLNNIQHTNFTARNSNWMFNEMENLTQTYNCEDYCDAGSLVINGDVAFCTNSNPYTIVNLPAGSTVVWSATPGGIVTNPTGTSPTLSKLANGIITLKATITNSCYGQVVISKPNIRVGSPKPGQITFSLIDPVMGKLYANIDPVPGASSYKWYRNGVLTSFNYGTSAHFVIPRNICDLEYDISVEAINGCGTSPRSHANAYIPCDYYFAVSPNPATSIVTISSVENNSFQSSSVKTFTEIKLYDNNGNLRKSQTYKNAKTASLTVSELQSGTYFLEISDGTFKERKPLIILK